jgi:hypothetical protein
VRLAWLSALEFQSGIFTTFPSPTRLIFAIEIDRLLVMSMTPSVGADTAFRGTQARDVTVGKHRFHIDPINVNGKTASGMIFHAMKWVPDDQIRYRITVANGQPTFDTHISRGGAGQFLPLPPHIKGIAGKIISGDWETALQVILDAIAAKL